MNRHIPTDNPLLQSHFLTHSCWQYTLMCICLAHPDTLYIRRHRRSVTLSKQFVTSWHSYQKFPLRALSHTHWPRTSDTTSDSVTRLTSTGSHIHSVTQAHRPTVLPKVSLTISHVLTVAVFHRRSDKHPPPLPLAPHLTRCWYRQTFPKPPVPSRSRISHGPPAPGRSPGGRSMGREGRRPQVPPLFPGRFRAAEARASFLSRDVGVTSGNCRWKSRSPAFPGGTQKPNQRKDWEEWNSPSVL